MWPNHGMDPTGLQSKFIRLGRPAMGQQAGMGGQAGGSQMPGQIPMGQSPSGGYQAGYWGGPLPAGQQGQIGSGPQQAQMGQSSASSMYGQGASPGQIPMGQSPPGGYQAGHWNGPMPTAPQGMMGAGGPQQAQQQSAMQSMGTALYGNRR